MLFIVITVESTRGQAFTFDYLTYSDYAENDTRNNYHQGKVTAFAFFGVNEFDTSGKALADNISYIEYYIYLTFRIVSTKRFQISIAPQFGGLAAEGISGITYGTPWMWAKYAPFRNENFALRIAFQLGRLGNSFWLEDDKIDVGLLVSKFIGPILIDGAVSYRLRRKSNQRLLDFKGLYNEAGNEIHYKLESSLINKKTLSLALFAFGYLGGDKKLDGAILLDSHSRKTSLGASIRINTKTERFFVLSIVYDAIGRYDKKGFSLVFNVID